MVRRSSVCKKKYRFLAIAPVSWFYTRSNGLVFGKCNRATEPRRLCCWCRCIMACHALLQDRGLGRIGVTAE